MGAAVLIGRGEVQWGAVVLILGLPLDALDGAVARAGNRTGKFGGVLDSTFDRAADALIYGMANLGINYAGWNPDWLKTFLGVMLIGAVVINVSASRRGNAR